MVWHWNCASSLCFNSWRTKGVHYYHLPIKNLELQHEYAKILKNEKVNWKKQVICSAHWTGGKRLSKDHIPDIICSEEQMKKMKKISELQPKDNDTKKKLMCAQRIITQQDHIGKKRKAPKYRSQVQAKKRKRRKSKHELEVQND